MMNQTSVDEIPVFEKKFIDEITDIGNIESTDGFFETEEKLLKHLYRLEKTDAQLAAIVMIDYITRSTQGDKLKGIKYYFITLSGIVARYIKKYHLKSVNALSFNETCIMLLEDKLTEDNAVDIAAELIELYIYMIADRKSPSLKHRTVNNIIQFIDNEVESPMSVEGLSSKFDVSTSHLSRIFREHTGITLVEYINIRKVEESQYYLRFSDKKIADISERFHFCNQSYFTRIFKKYTGETPRRFRTNLARGYFRFTLPDEESKLTGGE